MLTLVLLGALCTGDVCTHMEATAYLGVKSDAECFQMAAMSNAYNAEKNNPIRFACVEPERARKLINSDLKL